jgi:hypothetical protein
MEGGRFLGSGTYGCAFTPPLLCKSDVKKEFGKVGKITLDVLAQQEVLIGKLIRRAPLARNYFLLPEPEACTLAPEEKTSISFRIGISILFCSSSSSLTVANAEIKLHTPASRSCG